MRIPFSLLALSLALTLFSAGCAGPEKKLGRGLNNVTEFARLGEMRRSMEQTALWDSPSEVYTTGVIRGFNRSLARTLLGVYEIATFPFPSYEPLFTPKYPMYPDITVRNKMYPWGGLALTEHPVYPDSFHPDMMSNQIFSTDTNLGFSGYQVLPLVPGNRFHIFDY